MVKTSAQQSGRQDDQQFTFGMTRGEWKGGGDTMMLFLYDILLSKPTTVWTFEPSRRHEVILWRGVGWGGGAGGGMFQNLSLALKLTSFRPSVLHSPGGPSALQGQTQGAVAPAGPPWRGVFPRKGVWLPGRGIPEGGRCLERRFCQCFQSGVFATFSCSRER